MDAQGSMLKDKVLLTYKRKHFLCQPDVINDTKITNLACDISKVSSIDAHEEESKNPYPHITQGKMQCSTFDSTYGFHEPMQHHFPTMKVLRKCKAIGKQEHVLHSCELLNSTNTIGSILQKPGCSLVRGTLSNEKDTIEPRKLCSSGKIFAEGNSSAILEIDSQIGNSVHLTKNMDTEAKQFGSDSSLVGAKMSLNSNRGANGNVDGDESMRLSSKSPLITFSRRRTKSKQVLGERFVG